MWRERSEMDDLWQTKCRPAWTPAGSMSPARPPVAPLLAPPPPMVATTQALPPSSGDQVFATGDLNLCFDFVFLFRAPVLGLFCCQSIGRAQPSRFFLDCMLESVAMLMHQFSATNVLDHLTGTLFTIPAQTHCSIVLPFYGHLIDGVDG